jgi:hypothetical protein
MLRPIQVGNSLPLSYPVNPSHSFEPGMIASLSVIGNDIVCGVSDGLAPLGILDDVNTRAFTQPQVDEEVLFGPDLIGVPVVVPGGLVTATDNLAILQNPSIVRNSFVSDYPVIVNYRNGVVKIPAGSFLNYASIQGGTLDSIRIIVSYVYQVPDLPGDNTTLGSGRVTVWFQRGIWETDVFDTSQGYPLNATLFCGLDGKLTTRQPTPNHPGIAIVLGPPTATSTFLQFLYV